MKIIKRIIPYIILIALTVFAYYKRDTIYNIYKTFIVEMESKKITSPTKNEYYRNYDFRFVQNVEDYSPENKQDLLNVLISHLIKYYYQILIIMYIPIIVLNI